VKARRSADRPTNNVRVADLAAVFCTADRSPGEGGMADGVGVEPTGLSATGFQDQRNRPLCHPSTGAPMYYSTRVAGKSGDRRRVTPKGAEPEEPRRSK
jgi:hypothetical protein